VQPPSCARFTPQVPDGIIVTPGMAFAAHSLAASSELTQREVGNYPEVKSRVASLQAKAAKRLTVDLSWESADMMTLCSAPPSTWRSFVMELFDAYTLYKPVRLASAYAGARQRVAARLARCWRSARAVGSGCRSARTSGCLCKNYEFRIEILTLNFWSFFCAKDMQKIEVRTIIAARAAHPRARWLRAGTATKP
jgi:hypothetical protein